MPLFYVAGPSGAGKSAVAAELRRRGYPAYDADHDQLAEWYDGNYVLPPLTVQRVAAALGDATGFLCGAVSNEGEIWDLFTHVISLSVDAGTIRRRIAQRQHGFGSTPEELDRILAWSATVDADNARFGATLVDATRPLPEVVDDVLAVALR